MDRFVKVVSNVINLVQQLPEDLFLSSAPSSPTIASALASTESLTSDNSIAATTIEPGGARANIIKELVDTERKYVQDLEVMQVRGLHLQAHRLVLTTTLCRLRNTAMKLCPASIGTRYTCSSLV